VVVVEDEETGGGGGEEGGRVSGPSWRLENKLSMDEPGALVDMTGGSSVEDSGSEVRGEECPEEGLGGAAGRGGSLAGLGGRGLEGALGWRG
jgi:hypothetical protein